MYFPINKLLLSLVLTAAFSGAYAQTRTATNSSEKPKLAAPSQPIPKQTEPAPAPPVAEEVLVTVDEPAEFPGGLAGMQAYLAANLVYPPSAVETEREGKCYVKFVVRTDGSISNAAISKSVPNCPECDQEALRVVQAMPNWTPGKHQGKPVNCYFHLPITFQLTD